MACNQSTSFRIDREWAGLLKGLRMNVPDDWWDGFTGHKLNCRVIAHVNFGIDGNKIFQLKLDGERGAYYPMRYDAVVLIAPSRHSACPLMLSAIQRKRLLLSRWLTMMTTMMLMMTITSLLPP
jgi:hypothetical protein